MNIAEWLRAAARDRGGAVAVLDGTDPLWTYEELLDRCRDAAAVLRGQFDIRPGDRIVLCARNQPDYLVAMLAVWWVGAVVVPINVKLHHREIASIIANFEAALLLVDEDFQAGQVRNQTSVEGLRDLATGDVETVDDGPEPRADTDLAWIFCTSGTTGPPKGAMLTHGNLCATSMSYLADVSSVDPDRHYIYAAPMSHGAGLYAPIHVFAGARHVFPRSRRFDSVEVLSLAAILGSVSLFAAPTMVRRMVRAAREHRGLGSGLHTVVYGGGPMYLSDIHQALQTFGPCLVQIYGQGESPMTICALRKEQHVHSDPQTLDGRLSSVGTPHAVVSVRVVDEAGRPLATGQTGEIEVCGPTVMVGYWNDPQSTERVLRDGWLRTGDLGSFDDAGYLILRGRSKDVIITGGSNVYPREVEDVLLRHPGVDEAAVVGLPDDEWGEVVVAVVTATEGSVLEPAELDSHCLEELARFKRPRRYVLRSDLPKNAYGKVLKTALVEELTASPTD
ncbi:AMP-binding protein [Nocardia sp. NPDC047038]|uniref:class I adenylate-forming enzyme family protein n=1 Tax=Nocardia sp. NPDC047038 TaxID=3154338 RepID=UPI0033D9437C